MKYKLLVTVDGTKQSSKTIEYVAHACSGKETPAGSVVLFHILPALPPHVESSKMATAELRAEKFSEKAWAKAEQTLAEIKERLVHAGVKRNAVTTVAEDEEGDVVAQILAAAVANECDTIVVGRHEKSSFGRFLSGSVGEHLLRKARGYTIWLVE